MSIYIQQIFVINDSIPLSVGSDPCWSIHFTGSFPKAGRVPLDLKSRGLDWGVRQAGTGKDQVSCCNTLSNTIISQPDWACAHKRTVESPI